MCRWLWAACLAYVVASVRSHISKIHSFKLRAIFVLPVAVARSFDEDVVVRYTLPVLLTTFYNSVRSARQNVSSLRPLASCTLTKNLKPVIMNIHTYTGWAGTRKVKIIWILLKQETVSGSGVSRAICKSAHRSRQITTPATHHSVFTGRVPNQRVKALKASVKLTHVGFRAHVKIASRIVS